MIKHIVTGTYPLLVMESTGMMKIATGEGFPLRKGAGTGLDWLSVATGASGGGTPALLCSWKFLGYMEIYRRKKYVRGATRGPRGAHEGGGRAQGVGAPPCLVASSLLPLRGLQVSRVAFLPKISSVKFQVNWTPFDFPFLRYSKTR